MKKQHYDERQEQLLRKAGTAGFSVMFFLCPIIIITELLWRGRLEFVLGETVIFLAGGIVCIAVCMKNGIWSKSGKKAPVWQNLLYSLVFSGLFTFFYAIIISKKASENVNIAKYAVLFFIFIFLLGFLCLSVINLLIERKNKRDEEKYSDEE